MTSVGVAALAKVFNISVRRVQQLQNEGMPRAARGQYELGPCMQWYIRYLQAALEGSSDGQSDLVLGRIRVARETADRMQMANIRARDTVVLASKFRSDALKAIAFLKRSMAPVAARCTDDLVLREMIDKELRLARQQFALNLKALTRSPPK
jgi:hypothetical protein